MSPVTFWMPLSIIFTLLREPLLGGASVVVNVRGTAVLSCNGTCDGEFKWTFHPPTEQLEVLKHVPGKCTEGDGFKSRTNLTCEKIKRGNVSLILHPAVYSDEGWYDATCGSKMLCEVFLKVVVPQALNASTQDNVTLHCYARTEKDIANDAVNILWKRKDQVVLEVKNGNTRYGSGFTQRASVSLNHYRDGDLSLTLFRVTPSDSGLYHCYHKTEEKGNPEAFTLTVTARQSVYEKMTGDELTLDLCGLDRATITFTSSEGAEIQVCSIEGSTPTCDPKYNDRVSVRNGSVVLSESSSSDTGTFTVKDKMGEIMCVSIVTVKGATERHPWAAVAVVIGCVLISLIILIGLSLLCYRKRQQRRGPVYFSNQQSTVETDRLREPASIGISQEETSHDISNHLDITHSPVEETTPEISKTTEKQVTEEASD